MRDRLPTGPFQSWIERRVAHYENLFKFGGEVLNNTGVAARVAEDLGWTGGSGKKKLYRYRYAKKDAKPDGRSGGSVLVDADNFDRETVEEALFHAGAFLWEVYLEAEHPDLYKVPDVELAPTVVLLRPELVVEAKKLYDSGAPFGEVARTLFDRSGYASSTSLRFALVREFRNQGWKMYSLKEACQLRARRQCVAINVHRPNRGRQCRGAALKGSDLCPSHDPARNAWLRQHLSEVRPKEGELPIGQMVAWLTPLVEEEGSVNALARRLEMNSGTLWRVLNEYQSIKRETAQRILGPAFEELYGEAI